MSEQIIETPPASPPATVVTPPASPPVSPPPASPPVTAPVAKAKPSTVADAGKEVVEAIDDGDYELPDFVKVRDKLVSGNDKRGKLLGKLSTWDGLARKLENQEKLISDRALHSPKRPADDSTPEQIAEWRETVGLPATPEAYIEALKLPDGKVLGDEDKPVALEFAKAMHAVDAPPAAVSAGVGWYLNQVEEAAALQLEQDESSWATTSKALKEEMGLADYKRSVAAIELLFEGAPEGLKDRFLSARDATGRKIGGDAEVIKWLSGLAFEARPFAAIMDGGSEKTVSSRRAEIRAMLEKNDPNYWSPAIQKEEQDLIAAELRVKGRTQAAA